MTKKDYELIASVLKDDNFSWRALHGGAMGREYRKRISEVFADTLAEVNPRFQRDTFLKACGVEIEDNGWHCVECNYDCIWDRYEDGTPICPDCDIDLVR